MINSGVTLLNNDRINNKTYEDENFVREARYLVNRGDCYRASERLSDASLVSQFTASLHLTGWKWRKAKKSRISQRKKERKKERNKERKKERNKGKERQGKERKEYDGFTRWNEMRWDEMRCEHHECLQMCFLTRHKSDFSIQLSLKLNFLALRGHCMHYTLFI